MNDDLMSMFEGVDIIEEDVEVKNKSKKTNKEDVKNEKKSAKKEDTSIKYQYPFRIYLAAQYLDIDRIFEEEKEYSEKEITDAMLNHGFYEFAGNVTYDFRKNDNVLIPIFQQHKKG